MLSRVICDNFVPEAPFLLLLALRILCENLIRLGLHPHHPLSPPPPTYGFKSELFKVLVGKKVGLKKKFSFSKQNYGLTTNLASKEYEIYVMA